MINKVSFSDIWKKDCAVRLLVSGMVVDGLLLLTLTIMVGVIIAL